MPNNRPIKQSYLVELFEAGAVSSFRAVQIPEGWVLLAMVNMQARPLASQREDVKTFRSLDTVAKFLFTTLGAEYFEVRRQ